MKYTGGKFDHRRYIEDVIKAMKLDSAPPEVKEQLQIEIGKRIELRIIDTLIIGLGREEVEKFKKEMTENKNQDEMELLLSLAEKMPGMQELMIKRLNDLFEELTQDAEEIDKRIAERDKKE